VAKAKLSGLWVERSDPRSQQPKAKRALQEIWMAETKKNALAVFDALVETLIMASRMKKAYATRNKGVGQQVRRRSTKQLVFLAGEDHDDARA
jgi:hypothetical protein